MTNTYEEIYEMFDKLNAALAEYGDDNNWYNSLARCATATAFAAFAADGAATELSDCLDELAEMLEGREE